MTNEEMNEFLASGVVPQSSTLGGRSKEEFLKFLCDGADALLFSESVKKKLKDLPQSE